MDESCGPKKAHRTLTRPQSSTVEAARPLGSSVVAPSLPNRYAAAAGGEGAPQASFSLYTHTQAHSQCLCLRRVSHADRRCGPRSVAETGSEHLKWPADRCARSILARRRPISHPESECETAAAWRRRTRAAWSGAHHQAAMLMMMTTPMMMMDKFPLSAAWGLASKAAPKPPPPWHNHHHHHQAAFVCTHGRLAQSSACEQEAS